LIKEDTAPRPGCFQFSVSEFQIVGVKVSKMVFDQKGVGMANQGPQPVARHGVMGMALMVLIFSIWMLR
jgi:hypothetical protein